MKEKEKWTMGEEGRERKVKGEEEKGWEKKK